MRLVVTTRAAFGKHENANAIDVIQNEVKHDGQKLSYHDTIVSGEQRLIMVSRTIEELPC